LPHHKLLYLQEQVYRSAPCCSGFYAGFFDRCCDYIGSWRCNGNLSKIKRNYVDAKNNLP